MLPADLPPVAKPVMPSPYFRRALGGALLLWLLDQLSKYWVFEILLRVHGDARPFLQWLTQTRLWLVYDDPANFAERILLPFANLVMVWNRGVSFGMFAGIGGQSPFILMAVAGAIVLGLLVWLWRGADCWTSAALSLIMGGAIANMHDRLRFGAVADFLDLHVAGYHWPAFNLGDSAIVIGAILLALDALNLRPRRCAATPINGETPL